MQWRLQASKRKANTRGWSLWWLVCDWCWCLLYDTVCYKVKFLIAIAELPVLRWVYQMICSWSGSCGWLRILLLFRPRISNSPVKERCDAGSWHWFICSPNFGSFRNHRRILPYCGWKQSFHFKHIYIYSRVSFGFHECFIFIRCRSTHCAAGGGRPLQHCAHQWPWALHRGSAESLRGAIWEIDRSQLDDSQPEVFPSP